MAPPFSIPGEAVLPIGLGYLISSWLKHSRIQNVFIFYLGLALQSVALAALAATLILPIIDDLGSDMMSLIVYIAASLAALVGLVADAAFAHHYVKDATEQDSSLTNRTSTLVSLIPIGLTIAALFRVNFKLNLLAGGSLKPDSGPAYPLHILLSLGGVLVGFLTCGFAALWALFSPCLASEARASSVCISRIWFSTIFLLVPVSSACTGVAALLAPKKFVGMLVVVHIIVSVSLIGMCVSLVKNMLKSTNPLEQREFFLENGKM